MISKLKQLQPIDRLALSLILLLNLLIGLLMLTGDRTRPRVRDFSWQNKVVGSVDTAFILTFSRPMDRDSVEANLQIEPPLPGKISWVGKRLVYTLTTPVRYETTYQIKLDKAISSIGKEKFGNPIQAFVGKFRTPDRAFVYIGVEGEEKGRLILYNLTVKQKKILTPKNLVVKNFKPYPIGDRILFSAAEWSNNKRGLLEQSLYAVNTGRLSLQSEPTAETSKIDLILDSKIYQNLKFDLSSDGKAIVVQRINRNNLGDTGLWLLRSNIAPQQLTNRPAGDFLITPDSTSILNPQTEGIDILPLTKNAKPLDFIPSFRRVLDISIDGRKSAMIKFNSDATPSLFLVTNQGKKQELVSTQGQILNCKFNAAVAFLYCLVTRPKPGKKEYSEQLNLEAIDLTTFKISVLSVLPDRWETVISLSPDGTALLFDRVVEKNEEPKIGDLRTNLGTAIATSSIMLLGLNQNQPYNGGELQPQELPLRGFHPCWLP
ncbi:Ig-like domain-containing protein [Kamptonema sp. UHCC 0994]|uniref:Ig-like domain-containing protein n=1 Tax=Kamptonema sp. UHCC 0994 TaxID=3031329 RepID=UPI0023B96654|nr:Ig-like domain-containing protein [Kamptonema sp. UHCC 0994]MDF0553567.1 Ig-like domain-containing protein [Kamptonema sp. UHCC 0994]